MWMDWERRREEAGQRAKLTDWLWVELKASSVSVWKKQRCWEERSNSSYSAPLWNFWWKKCLTPLTRLSETWWFWMIFKKIWRWCLTCWMYTNDIDDSNEIVLMVDNMTCVDDNDNCHCHCHMDLEQGCTRRCEWAKDPFHSSHSPIHVNNPCNSETGSVVRCDWECIQSASLGAKHRERWQLSRSLHLGTKNTRSSFSKTSQAKKDDWNE